MKVIKAPASRVECGPPTLFLAGSIEMGAAEDWQERLTAELVGVEGTIFNPRRDDWDSSWEQSISNPKFVEQVEWELQALDEADIIALYLAPGTKSPISLLELGLYARHRKLIVYCPDGFWRKGNVDIVCNIFGVQQEWDWDGFVKRVRNELIVMKAIMYRQR